MVAPTETHTSPTKSKGVSFSQKSVNEKAAADSTSVTGCMHSEKILISAMSRVGIFIYKYTLFNVRGEAIPCFRKMPFNNMNIVLVVTRNNMYITFCP